MIDLSQHVEIDLSRFRQIFFVGGGTTLHKPVKRYVCQQLHWQHLYYIGRGGTTDFKVGGGQNRIRKRISVQYNTILYSIVLYCTLNTRVFNVQPKADGSQLNLPRGSLVHHTDVL